MATAKSSKIIVLGIDGLDPSLTNKFLAEGLLPNVAELIKRGSARQDLVMLGGMPTVTPPMWTTLSTGATPAVHGITGFWNQDPDNLAASIYCLDSRMSKAEPLWNVTARQDIPTLVWHWPGSSWPPTSDSPNLHVVEGTQPGSINMGVAGIDWEKVITASSDTTELIYKHHGEHESGAGCVITDMEDMVATNIERNNINGATLVFGDAARQMKSIESIKLSEEDGEVTVLGKVAYDKITSPIRPAKGWRYAPEGAKEMTIITSEGLTRRPALILPNEAGTYDTIAIYTTKKDETPLVSLHPGELIHNISDTVMHKERLCPVVRSMKLISLSANGSEAKLWLSNALDTGNNSLWSPAGLYAEITANVGPVPPVSLVGGSEEELVQEVMLPMWENYVLWQADCLNYFIQQERYQMIFSHVHNVDAVGHQLWHFAKNQPSWPDKDEKRYQEFIRQTYQQADRYLGRFLPILDQGWTIFVVSDHGLITTPEIPPLIGEPGGVNARVMQELGYTSLLKDENGQDMKKIDWANTRAIMTRGNHIYLNIKGRNRFGIVEPSERYALEEEIISALYNYRDPRTGRRPISICLRNKDAILLGMSGPECGDIIMFMEEGFTRIHADSLSTQNGYFDTSVSPIFIAAGQGIKSGYVTERIIRETDLAPTIATLLSVPMPAQCEGAPVYQILAD